MDKKLLLLLSFVCFCFLSAVYSEDAKTKDRASSSIYESVNFDAFEIVSKDVKDLEISSQTIGDRKELVIRFLGTCYELQVYFKSNIQKRSSFFGKGSFVLPPEPIKYAHLVNRETDTYLKLDIAAYHEKDKLLNYVACGDTARIDIFTDLHGSITQADIAYELEKGGMEEYRNFLRIYTLNRSKINSSQ